MKDIRDNKQNSRELTDILKKVVHIFMNINPKRIFSSFGQLSKLAIIHKISSNN